VRPTYKVYLDFGESDEEWERKNPGAGHRRDGVYLSFGHGAERFVRVRRPE